VKRARVTGDVSEAATVSATSSDTAEMPSPTRGSILLSWTRRVVVVAVVASATVQLVRQWSDVSGALAELSWPRLVVSGIAVTAGVLLSPLVWQSMLAALDVRVGKRDASKIYLVGQLGKYVPGSVVAILLQMELARSVGITRARSFTASLLTAGVVVVASLLAGTLAIPAFVRNEPGLMWLFVLLPIGLAMLHPRPLTVAVNLVLRLLRRAPLPHRLSGAAVARAAGLSVLTYALYGVHLYALAAALRGTWQVNAGIVLLLCVGSMGLAMTAGLVAFFLPSGIGARELVIVGGLTTVLPYGQALALAVVSRLLFTLVELTAAGVAALVVKLSRGRPQQS
jgi:glycosyltransferase 2 family protein